MLRPIEILLLRLAGATFPAPGSSSDDSRASRRAPDWLLLVLVVPLVSCRGVRQTGHRRATRSAWPGPLAARGPWRHGARGKRDSPVRPDVYRAVAWRSTWNGRLGTAVPAFRNGAYVETSQLRFGLPWVLAHLESDANNGRVSCASLDRLLDQPSWIADPPGRREGPRGPPDSTIAEARPGRAELAGPDSAARRDSGKTRPHPVHGEPGALSLRGTRGLR